MSKIKNEILLETGTNEIEIMEFVIGANTFGINVAKVREIMMVAPVKPIPHAHEAIEGVFKPREDVITVVNLPMYLGIEKDGDNDKDLFIITNFNKMEIAFRVHRVVGINRISWEAIQKPDKTIYGGNDGVATGIAEYDNRLITILDFEKIIADISPSTTIQMSEIDKMGKREVRSSNIVMAEDSIMLAKMIHDCLTKAGYGNITQFNNGQEMWDYLSSIADSEHLYRDVGVIITDIEMPQMDGHRLTKLVKEHPRLKKIPLIIFSSLINEEMYIKGKQLGASEQLSKPEIGHLVEVIDLLLENKS